MRRNHARQRLFWLLYAVALTGFCVSGALLLHTYRDRAQAADFYGKLADMSAPVPAETSDPATEEMLPALCTRVAQLQGDYPDVVAWLQIPGAPVDYPVVQGTDNQQYLDTLPDGTGNAAGSIFLDCRTPLDGTHLILYGHNMRGGSMFGSLREYLKQGYLEQHPEFSLYTAAGELRCRIFSVARVDAYSGDVYAVALAGHEDVQDFVRRRQAASAYPIPTDTQFDRVVTLSTCTGRVSTERLVVQAGVLSGEQADKAAGAQ